ncbi:putative nucleotide-binding alpha-beta plait domain superfamily, RNA-binding domain superfamily [Helianthus annuus]|nr:putative nucleotide-binding alpha-beta plait domain superfamily, RNA-binding domain superfamily [Helianthus annuus]
MKRKVQPASVFERRWIGEEVKMEDFRFDLKVGWSLSLSLSLRLRLWQAFSFLENLEDVFVPWKRDRAGNTFGFVKLSNVKEVDTWINRLKEVKIDGAVIGVNLAKFNRDGSKTAAPSTGERVSVFSRLTFDKSARYVQSSMNTGQNLKPRNNDGRSYCDVVNQKNVFKSGTTIELPPLNTDTKKKWEFKSLVGEAKDIEIPNNLKLHLTGLVEEGPLLRYLGGLKVLVSFSNIEEADDFLRNKSEIWAIWLSRLYVWDGIPPLFKRVAWIKVIGVPVSLWDCHVLNRIGERCGRPLVKSEASAEDGNMSGDRMAILVSTGKRISLEMNITWKDHMFSVWVEEITGLWSPAFLSDDSPDVSDVGLSPEFEESSEYGGVKSKSCMLDSEPSCMGNNMDSSSPKVVSQEQDCDFPITPRVAAVADQEEREGVGHVDEDFNSPQVGPYLDPTRPSFIPTRSKRNSHKNIVAQNVAIPDLNDVVEIGDNSDPFNLREIFRIEEEERIAAIGVELSQDSPVMEDGGAEEVVNR